MTNPGSPTRFPSTYRRLWWASAVNNIGDGVFTTAVPLLTITLTRNPELVSVVSAATHLPWLLLSLPAGALVDRHDRVNLMWRSQALQASRPGRSDTGRRQSHRN